MKKTFSTELFGQFFLNSISLFCIFNSHGILVKVNPEWERVLGFSLAELEGKSCLDFVHPEDIERTRHAFSLLNQKKRLQNFLNRLRRHDGTYLWVEWQAFLKGDMVYATARKTSIYDESRLAEEQIFDNIYDISPEMITVTSLSDGAILYTNEKFTDYLGHRKHEYLGRTVYDLGVWPNPEDRMAITDELIRKGRINNVEIVLRAKDGHFLDCLFSANLIKYKGINCMVSVVYDITERKKIEKDLQESEKKYRLLFENMTNAFALHEMIYDETGKPTDYRYLEANPTFEKLTGLSAKDIIGKTIKEIAPATEDYWIQNFGEVASTCISKNYINYWEESGKYYDTYVFAPEKGKFAVMFSDKTDMILAQQQLRKSEEQFRNLVTNLDVIHFALDREGIFTLSEGRALKKLGLDPGRIVGLSIWELYHDVPEVIKGIKKCFQGESVELVAHLGELYFESRYNPVFDENKQIIGVHGVAVDITDRIKAEKALKISEARFRDMVENMPIGLGISDLAGNISYINKTHYRYFGYDLSDIPTVEAWFLLAYPNEQDREKTLSSWKKRISLVLNSETKFTPPQFYTVRTKSGGYIDIEVSFTIIGKQIYTLFSDITEKTKALNHLQESEERLRNFIDATTEGIVIINENGIIKDWNKSAELISGIDKNEILNHHWWDMAEMAYPEEMLTGKVKLHLEETMARMLQTGICPDFMSTFSLVRRDKSTRYVEQRNFSFRTEHGYNLAGIFTDITDRKKAEEALVFEHSQMLSIFDGIDGRFYVADPGTYEILYANKALKTEKGNDIVGKTCYQVLEGLPEPCLYCTNHIIQNQKPETYRWEHFNPTSGSTYDVHDRIIRWPDGRDVRLELAIDISERIRAEKEIKQLSKLQQTILDTVNVGITMVKDRKHVWVNAAVCKIFGYTMEEMVDAPTSRSYAYSKDSDYIGNIGYPHILKGEIFNSEFQIRRKDGTLGWIYLSGKAITPSKPEDGSIWMLQDITERKNAEETIKKSEAQLRSITRNIPGMVFQSYARKNGEMGYYYVSDVAKTFHGIDNDDLNAFLQSFMARVDEEDLPGLQASIKAAVESVSHWQWEGRYHHPDGMSMYIRGIAQPRIVNDEVIFDGLMLDITSQKLAEASLNETRERLQSFMDSATDAFTIWDSNLKLVDLNKNAMAYIHEKKSKEEFLGQSIDDFIPEFKSTGGLDKYYEVLRTGKAFLGEDKVMIKGRPFWLDVRIFKVGDGLGMVTSDISGRKNTEEEIRSLNAELEKRVYERTLQLEQANKDLEAFAYSVSHDLRAPLRHIDGFIQLMYGNMEARSEKITGYYGKINDATRRMSSLIDELLSFSRLGRKELSLASVNMNALIRDIIEQFRPDYAERNIEWKTAQLPSIRGDMALLKIAFENLISNAIKYTSRKKQALIEIGFTQDADDFITYYVRDNGAGFNMTYSEKLFGVFQRLHSKEEFDGIGIGLANVKQIITKHNGTIHAESVVNEGATFYVTLPK
jgi:PAS domain S-box-containing protein